MTQQRMNGLDCCGERKFADGMLVMFERASHDAQSTKCLVPAMDHWWSPSLDIYMCVLGLSKGRCLVLSI